jgi:hypothetical protein
MQITLPQWICQKHGNVGPSVITSDIPEHGGQWCQICWIESLDAAGVHRCQAATPPHKDG